MRSTSNQKNVMKSSGSSFNTTGQSMGQAKKQNLQTQDDAIKKLDEILNKRVGKGSGMQRR
jgi:hypothetical protein